jgi:NADH dehydrogenase (ubiquinone) 1 alpha subcomplex subunit 9
MGDVGQVVSMRFSEKRYDTIADICARSNVVVNCIGRNFDKFGETIEFTNINVAESIAKV